ncbi:MULTISPECIES: ATP-binding protein [unclassified Streptomyces]|uniref:ATP-binding protein n=1 Tax=Streptomyces sp. SYP-A7185 TaxID=3040076 RepID=UPI0038F67906
MTADAPSDWPRENGPSAPQPAGSPAASPALPATAEAARGHVLRVLQERADRCGDAVGERALADVLLVVSELFTNALRHGGGVTRFEVSAGDQVIRVTVGDRSAELPQNRRPSGHLAVPGGEGGYGWPLVRQLATDVTLVLDRSEGKLITVSLPLA